MKAGAFFLLSQLVSVRSGFFTCFVGHCPEELRAFPIFVFHA